MTVVLSDVFAHDANNEDINEQLCCSGATMCTRRPNTPSLIEYVLTKLLVPEEKMCNEYQDKALSTILTSDS